MLFRLIRSVLFVFAISIAVAVYFVSDSVNAHRIVRLKSEITELRSEKSKTEEQLKIANLNNEQQKQEIVGLQRRITELRSNTTNLQSSNRQLQEELNNIASLQRENTRLRNDSIDLRRQLGSQRPPQQQRQQATAATCNCRSIIEKLTEERDNFRNQLEALLH